MKLNTAFALAALSLATPALAADAADTAPAAPAASKPKATKSKKSNTAAKAPASQSNSGAVVDLHKVTADIDAAGADATKKIKADPTIGKTLDDLAKSTNNNSKK